jgi:hypothetical protein
MRRYALVSGVFLCLLALVQLLRLVLGWPVQVTGMTIPLWPSVIAFLIAGGLGVWGLRCASSKDPTIQ